MHRTPGTHCTRVFGTRRGASACEYLVVFRVSRGPQVTEFLMHHNGKVGLRCSCVRPASPRLASSLGSRCTVRRRPNRHHWCTEPGPMSGLAESPSEVALSAAPWRSIIFAAQRLTSFRRSLMRVGQSARAFECTDDAIPTVPLRVVPNEGDPGHAIQNKEDRAFFVTHCSHWTRGWGSPMWFTSAPPPSYTKQATRRSKEADLSV